MVITNRAAEPLTDEKADEFIAAIVARTRRHPEIMRGASVRGAIALREVLQGYRIMHGLTRQSLARAALTTLPHRMTVKGGDSSIAASILRGILNEVLYGIRLPDTSSIKDSRPDELSPEAIMEALKNLGDARPLDEPDASDRRREPLAMVPDAQTNQDKLSQHFNEDSLSEAQKWQMAYTRAIEQMLEQLDEKLKRGEISEKDFERESRRLRDMLGAAAQLQSYSSSNDMAQTVLEMMDARDKRWQKDLKHQDMYVYYHIKSTCEGKEVGQHKQNWHGLKVIIDYLKEQGMVLPVEKEGFALTAEALDILLENFVPEVRRGDPHQLLNSAQAQLRERLQETRRYVQGDVYRDISVRHTLRQIAKQRKPLSEISRRDLRVFLKQRRKPQSDIVLCLDSSGSMGFYQKLIYARLFAAGLARSALQRGDRVGLVNFDDVGRSVLPLTDKKEDIFRYIIGTSPGGNTNMGDGIRCAVELLMRQPGRNDKYIVLITDGEPTAISQQAFSQFRSGRDFDATEESAILETRKASSRGIKTSVVHITDSKGAGKELVRKLAQAGMGQIKKVISIEDIKNAIWQ